ncbi:MAG: hypothetical protein OEM38_04280 [Gammaproteobacteria bacterium]|nr:hypothetical protein [Gammaproteobacteria bacterium]
MKFVSIFVSYLLTSAAFAADESINDLMQGFDESPQESSNQDIDNLFDGFDDTQDKPTDSTPTLDTPKSEETTEAKKNWNITTLLSLSSSYSYQQNAPTSGEADYRGLSRLKLKLQPEFRYKINSKWDSVFSLSGFYDLTYQIKDRSKFTTETLDSNESELEVRELYLRGTLNSSLDVKVGRQIVVWGKSDSLRVVDVLNPLDFREPGMVDIEDLRLPVTMLKADYYTGDWNISAIAVPEIRFNKMPPFGSDFYLGGSTKFPSETIPDDVKNPELALAMIGNFSGWDVSFHFANYYDDQPHVVKSNPKTLEHSRLNLAGAAANIVTGSWLFKSEAAYIDGLEFANAKADFSRADIMFGIDYNGIVDMTFSIEAVNRHLLDYNEILDTPPDYTKVNESQVSLRHTASFIHDKLTTTILTSFFGTSPDDGGFYRASLDYEIDSGMSIILGGIVYQSGDSLLLNSIASNDRVFADFRYSF